MQKVAARIFDCSLDGVIAEEDTKFFQYCRDLPDDPAQRRRKATYQCRYGQDVVASSELGVGHEIDDLDGVTPR